MKIELHNYESISNTISLPPYLVKQHKLEDKKTILVQFGSWKSNLNLLKLTDNANQNILLSQDLYHLLSISSQLDYELLIRDDKLLIGPVIGILIAGKLEKITPRILNGYQSYFINYPKLKGMIILFTEDGILWDEKAVCGFLFDPEQNDWIQGKYVFPSAFFARKKVNFDLHQKFTSKLNVPFFNAYNFNKWEMWEWLSKNDEMRKILPETIKLESLADVQTMLNKYSKIFIKPTSGMGGFGIFMIEINKEQYTLTYKEEQENKVEFFDNEYDLFKNLDLKLNLNKRDYIIQHEIKLIHFDQRKADIRVILQKGEHGEWYVPGMITRYGEPGSIVSNISRGGKAEKTWETLLQLYDGNKNKAYQKWKEIELTAIMVGESLDSTDFLYGNLGIDIGMDQSEELWLIEINNRYPDPTIAFDANDPALYYQIRSNPLKYAKWLSGFIKD